MYPQFRCTECSLLRCTTPNIACEECLENMGLVRTRFGSIISDIIKVSLVMPSVPSPAPFVNVPQGWAPGGHLTACIANGPGVLRCITSNSTGGSIRFFDGDANCGNSPQSYSQMINQRMLFEWLNTPSAMQYPVHVPFQLGLTITVFGGDYALRFSDVLGSMFLVPY